MKINILFKNLEIPIENNENDLLFIVIIIAYVKKQERIIRLREETIKNYKNYKKANRI